MPGTTISGKKAAITNRDRYGSDYYHKLGHLGGSRKVKKGFALMSKEKHLEASLKGGTLSKRGPAKLHPGEIRVKKQQARVNYIPVRVERTRKKSFWDKLREIF